ECRDVVHIPSSEQCAFVRQYCVGEATSVLDYTQFYYCSMIHVKPVGMFILILWLCVLFLTLGLSASDYLCPNLSTLSNLIGLSQGVAGVTLLALGNGSPDLLSTYAAFNADSVSLALGELIGSALFISAVVAGSMAIIRPFEVGPKSFTRDSMFLVLSMSVILPFITNGKLSYKECITLVLLYFAYVAYVGFHFYYYSKSFQGQLIEVNARNQFSAPGAEEPLPEDAEITNNHRNNNTAQPGIEALQYTDSTQEDEVEPLSPQPPFPRNYQGPGSLSRNQSKRQSRTSHISTDDSLSAHSMHTLPRSLIQASEFNSIINSLKVANLPATGSPNESNDFQRFLKPRTRTLEGQQQYQHHHYNSSKSRRISQFMQSDSVSEGRGNISPKFFSSPTEGDAPFIESVELNDRLLHVDIPNRSLSVSPLPRLSRTSSATSNRLPSIVSIPSNAWISKNTFQEIMCELLEPLIGFREKPFFNKLISILVLPSVICMKITVPVISDEDEEDETINDAKPIVNVLPGESAATVSDAAPLDVNSKTEPTVCWERWLYATNCFAAPIFFGLVNGGDQPVLTLLYSLVVSLILLLAFLRLTSPEKPPKYLKLLCMFGFVASLCWVELIATEVVGVLKSFGVILGISDDILGLTVFAIGNSLGDLVADITIARMGYPIMALGACFGGPLLNLLLGIGISGSIAVAKKSSAALAYECPPTILVSGIALIINVVFLLSAIWYNNWRFSRLIGIVAVLIWLITTIINVLI
ncbi:hypothetical protein CANCADRAFT_19192, partial [Tortispora caseinolytica NRRL Y-17796]